MKALATIGGWGGGLYFSYLVSTAESRAAFASTLLNFTTFYKLDGIDIEYVATSHLLASH